MGVLRARIEQNKTDISRDESSLKSLMKRLKGRESCEFGFYMKMDRLLLLVSQ